MKMTGIKGIHHVSLKPVGYAEFQKVTAFYRDVLGLETVRAWGEGDTSAIMLRAGGSLIEISANGDKERPQGAIHHYALATDDVDGVLEKVRQAGYPITVEPNDKILPTHPPFPIRMAFFIGPCGETVELFCEK